MSIRIFFNSVKEGLQGIIRHPLVALASISTILLMLLIMSAFLIFSANARLIIHNVSQKPPIEVYMKLGRTPEESAQELKAMESFINNNQDRIKTAVQNSPEENYIMYKEILGENAEVLEGLDYKTYLPYTFKIQLQDPQYAEEIAKELALQPGVGKIKQKSEVMTFLTRATRYVNLGTAVAFGVLSLISLFIISNMVRISVYSRAEEISIMKYVGASHNYIRLPYVIEGAIVGFISAVLAWGIAFYSYDKLYDAWMANSTNVDSFFSLLHVSNLSQFILIVAVVIGVLIGAFGSGISVKKYIKV